MMLSLQNSINSRNGPGGNKNRSVWLRVGVTGVAFQAVNQPCGTKGRWLSRRLLATSSEKQFRLLTLDTE